MGTTYDIVADGDLCYPEMIMCDGYKNAVFNSLLKFCKHECLEHSNIPTKVPKNGEILKNKNENMQLCKVIN